MRLLLFTLFLFYATLSAAQEYVYVNTDSLLIRDRPENEYLVTAVLHAPTRLVIEQNDEGYAKNKVVTSRFYNVSLQYRGDDNRSTKIDGWVEKKYVVRSKSLITFRGTDTTQDLAFRRIFLIPFIGGDECDPNDFNCRDFPYPKYKGGEKSFPAPVKRVYHTGPRGGCYYIGPSGNKNYVDPKHCK